MDGETRRAVRARVIDLVRRAIERNSVASTDSYDPFRSRLIPDEYWKVPKFERSLSTSMGGSSGFEGIARIVAEGAGHSASNQYLTEGNITAAQSVYIAKVCADLRANRARPDWDAEVEGLVALADSGPKDTLARVNSDLYVSAGDGDRFYTMKTVKPNLDQTEKAKSDCLTLLALEPEAEAFFSLAYNPYGEDRARYAWAQPSKLFDMHLDDVVLIGRDFWDDVGGEGTYGALLEVFDSAGEELEDEIERFFAS